MDLNSAGDAVQLLSCKGTLPILEELVDGPKRHNELARGLGIDHKSLDRTLRRLQAARLVVREVQPVPLRVTYRLAPEAEPLLPALNDLGRAWHTLRRRGPDDDRRAAANGNGNGNGKAVADRAGHPSGSPRG